MCFGAQEALNEPQNLKFVARGLAKGPHTMRKSRQRTRRPVAGGRLQNPAAIYLVTTRTRKSVDVGRPRT